MSVRHGKFAWSLGSILAAAAGGAAHGQALEEIVVTAQKREQSVQDVGISVTALSGDQLRELGITNTADVVRQVPGLQISTFTPAFIAFNLRGVSQNNFQDNLEAPVAVYMDEVYMASMNGLGGQLFDVERVEVLRGPQGTLFGRNATGGLIHYITRGADEAEVNGYLEGTVADYDKYSLEGAVGGGLTDRLRARLAARWEEADGYVKSTTDVRDAHGANGYAVRGNLQYDFTDSVLGELRVAYSRDDDVPSGAYTVAPATFDPETGFGVPLAPPEDPLAHNSNYQGRLDRDVTSVTGKLTWNLANGLELVSISNYTTLDKFYTEDADGDVINFPYTTTADVEQLSQELRLSGATDRMRWQVGAYYFDLSLDMGQIVEGEIILGGPTERVDTLAVLDSRNWSVFGQAEFDLTDALTLITGLRWSQDDKDIDMQIVFSDVPNGIPPTLVFDLATDPDFVGLDEVDEGDWAARIGLNYDVNERVMIYASYNRGIKGGNWSIAPGGGVDPSNFRHRGETLNAYELGVKSDFAGGRARLNAGVFYYDYEDYQAFSLNNLIPQVTNSDAEASGGEIELNLWPTDNWYLQLGAAFIDSEVDTVPTVFGGITTDREFPNAPSWSLTVLGRYSWPALGGRFSVQVDGLANDDQFLEGTNSAVSFEESYSVWNARLAYTSGDENWEIAGWVRNFTDETYRLYNLDLGLGGFIESVYAPPRWWGVTATYRW